MSDAPVVAAPQRLSKAELHAKIMLGWSRAISNMGRGRFMDELDISSEALRKQLGGSLPAFDTIDRALDVEKTLLDDWLAAKGLRLVDKDSVCDTDDVSVMVSRLLNRLIEAQHPDSPGGRRIVPTEIMGEMENLLREVVRVASTMLDQAAAYRGDVVDLRRRA